MLNVFHYFAFSGLYRWEDSHRKAVYTNWAFDEPSNSASENCVRKTFNIGYEGWHDVDCGLSYEVGYGEQHALCQAFNDSKNCVHNIHNSSGYCGYHIQWVLTKMVYDIAVLIIMTFKHFWLFQCLWHQPRVTYPWCIANCSHWNHCIWSQDLWELNLNQRSIE